MLTSAQIQTLHNDIISRPELADYVANGNDVALAAFYNALAAPDYIVWKFNVALNDIIKDSAFAWDRVDNLTTGKARIFDWMFRSGSINPSQSNVRAGIDATWVGTAADLAVRASVYAVCKRKATLLEKLFATGSGTDASPSVMAVEGLITSAEISGAR